MLREGDNSPVGTIRSTEPLAHWSGNTATGGVWRVHGANGSAVLKHTTPNGTDETHWNHWRREPLAYREGLLATYCADTDLTTPRLLDAIDREDGSSELWLADVSATPGEQCGVERLGLFARQLGAAQARYVGARQLPSWLSRRFLRHYTSIHRFTAIDWDHPTAAAHWPRPLRDGLRRLWERRGALLDLAERLPATVCHLDVWPKNLFAEGNRSILIDWAFMGHGAIGEDIGNLIPDTVFDGLLDVRLLDAIRETVTESYIKGFAAAGGQLPEADIRRAIAITGAAKYVWLAPLMLTRLSESGSLSSQSYDPASGNAEVLQRRRPTFELLTAWAGFVDNA